MVSTYRISSNLLFVWVGAKNEQSRSRAVANTARATSRVKCGRGSSVCMCSNLILVLLCEDEVLRLKERRLRAVRNGEQGVKIGEITRKVISNPSPRSRSTHRQELRLHPPLTYTHTPLPPHTTPPNPPTPLFTTPTLLFQPTPSNPTQSPTHHLSPLHITPRLSRLGRRGGTGRGWGGRDGSM